MLFVKCKQNISQSLQQYANHFPLLQPPPLHHPPCPVFVCLLFSLFSSCLQIVKASFLKRNRVWGQRRLNNTHSFCLKEAQSHAQFSTKHRVKVKISKMPQYQPTNYDERKRDRQLTLIQWCMRTILRASSEGIF